MFIYLLGFPSPSWAAAPIWETKWANKKLKNWGAQGAPNGFKNLTRSMMIPNMCLVLKLDNGKEVSIANEQTDRITEPSSTVLVYRYFNMQETKSINLY